MKEVRRDHVRNKRRILFLEYNSDDVVAYVPLPLQLQSENKTFNEDRYQLGTLGQ